MLEKYSTIISGPQNTMTLDNVDMVIIPGHDGVMGVLKNHAPVITLLKHGIVSVVVHNTTTHYFVDGGFADISAGQCIILTEHYENVENIEKAELIKKIDDLAIKVKQTVSDDERVVLNQTLTLTKSKLEIIKNLTH